MGRGWTVLVVALAALTVATGAGAQTPLARERYDQGRHAEAAALLARALDAGIDEEATFLLGKSLYHLALPAASLAVFDGIVDAGAGHRYFAATLQWLALLSERLPEGADVARRVGRYEAADLAPYAQDARLHDRLLLLLGQSRLHDGRHDEAAALLARVRPGSREHRRARFVLALAHARAHRPDAATAVLRALLRDAAGAPGGEPGADFLWLELARVEYSSRRYVAAVEGWSHVGATSRWWPDALFEQAWGWFIAGDGARALANLQTLDSAFLRDTWFPESPVLRALVHLSACRYAEAREAAAHFHAGYGAVAEALARFSRERPDDADLLALRRGPARVPLALRPVVASALADPSLDRALDLLARLDDESRRLRALPGGLAASATCARLLQDLGAMRARTTSDAGALARRRLAAAADELRRLGQRAEAILAEAADAERDTALPEGVAPVVVPALATPTGISVEDELQLWPFTGEYWRDEQGHYREHVRSRCPR